MADHPDELRQRLTAQQIAGWMAFAIVEPFGPAAEERLAAIIACTVEGNSGRKAPRRLTEFMPSEAGREWTEDEIAAHLAGRFNGAGG